MYLKVFNFVTSNIYKINTFCIWVLLINHKFQFHHKSYWSCYIFTDLVYLVRKVMHEIVQFLSLSTQFLRLWISDVQNMTHNDEIGTFWNLYLGFFILSIWELGASLCGSGFSSSSCSLSSFSDPTPLLPFSVWEDSSSPHLLLPWTSAAWTPPLIPWFWGQRQAPEIWTWPETI